MASNDDSMNTNWTSQEFGYLQCNPATYTGRFTLEAKKYCDSIQVTYFCKIYRNAELTETRIQLSINYNKQFITALDTILNYAAHSKYFKIEKYVPPIVKSGIYKFNNGDVIIGNLRARIDNSDPPSNITIFIADKSKSSKLLKEINNDLSKAIFGEELLLKKIGLINYKYSDTIESGLLTINQLREKLAY
jgi:hypothetical protein